MASSMIPLRSCCPTVPSRLTFKLSQLSRCLYCAPRAIIVSLALQGRPCSKSVLLQSAEYKSLSHYASPFIISSTSSSLQSHHNNQLTCNITLSAFSQQWPLTPKSPTASTSLSPSRASIKLPRRQLCRWHRMHSIRLLISFWPILSPQALWLSATKDTATCTATTTMATSLATAEALYGTAASAAMVPSVLGTPTVLAVVTSTVVLAS